MTSSDGSTTTLMVPGKTGTYVPVADRFGKPIQATWNAIQASANQGSPPLFGNPGPGTLHTPQGQPGGRPCRRRAASSSSSRPWSARRAVAATGCRARSAPWAAGKSCPRPRRPTPRGCSALPLDTNRLQNDPAYNQTIGQAVLADAWRKFGGDPVLAAVAYNAGPRCV